VALTAGSNALMMQRAGGSRVVDSLSPQARRLVLLAGVVAAGGLSVLAPKLGASSTIVYLVGGAALVSAVLSSYAAIAVLIVLLLVPISTVDLLPIHLNSIDAVYAASVVGIVLRMIVSDERVELSPLGLALVSFVLAGLLALAAGMLGSSGTSAALSHFRGLFGYALIPVLVLQIGGNSVRRRTTLLSMLCVVGALTAARGVLSWAELNGTVKVGGILHQLAAPEGSAVGVVPASSHNFGYVRAWAGNLEGNTLGAFTLALLPAAVGLALRRSNALARLGFAAAALLLLVALLVTYSRGAYLGLAVAATIALLVFGRRRPLAAALTAAAGLALLIFLVTHLPGTEDRLNTLHFLGQDRTVQHRQLVYAQAFDSIRASPIWGVGLGTPVDVIGTGADSLYVFVLLRGGMLAAGAAIALLWTAGQRVIAAWRAGRFRPLDVAVLIGLSGVAAHSLVDYTLWNPKVALVVWLLAGFVMAAAMEGISRETGDANALGRTSPR
jgi:putative inorganic carbon (HCO3(-)) transporter